MKNTPIIHEFSSDETTQESEIPAILIQPPRGWVGPGFAELWGYRDLLQLFVWRDIKVRYKQTFVGASWAVIQPFVAMVVLSLFFGKLAKVPSEGVPYPIFSYCALVPWTYFVNVLTQSTNSVVSNRAVVTRIYFPRLLVPMTPVMTNLLDFLIAFVILVGMMLYYGITPTVAVLALPFFVLLTIATALGLGLWLAALHVQYRDIGFALPFLTQIWLFATPIAYPSSLVPEKWRAIYGLNPMAGVVEGFRWALLGKSVPPVTLLVTSVVVVLLLLVGGVLFFRNREDTFSDVI